MIVVRLMGVRIFFFYCLVRVMIFGIWILKFIFLIFVRLIEKLIFNKLKVVDF